QLHWGGANTQPEDDCTASRCKKPVVRQRKGNADRRMPRHWKFDGRREYSDANIRGRRLSGEHEGRLGEAYFRGYALHYVRVQPGGVRKNGQLVPSEGVVREYVKVQVSILC